MIRNCPHPPVSFLAMLSRRCLPVLLRPLRRSCSGTPLPPPPPELPKEQAVEFLSDVVNGGKGLPRAGIVQSLFGNQMTKFYLRTACPGFFDNVDQDVPKGAIAGLELLSASIDSDDYSTILSHCAEKKFYDEYSQSVAKLSPLFKWKLNRIRSAKLDTLFGVIGAQRGDSMKGKQFLELMGQHFVVSPEFADAIKIADFRERASKSLPFLFADGAIIRARVLVTVDQTVAIPTVNEAGEVVAGKEVAQTNVEHMMTLENSLTPRIGKKQMLASETILELTEDPMSAGNWKIVDVNFSLSDNYPLDPPSGMVDDADKKDEAKQDEE